MSFYMGDLPLNTVIIYPSLSLTTSVWLAIILGSGLQSDINDIVNANWYYILSDEGHLPRPLLPPVRGQIRNPKMKSPVMLRNLILTSCLSSNGTEVTTKVIFDMAINAI